MRILRVLRFAVGIEAWCVGQILLAIHHLDVFARLIRGRRRYARRVSAHVGDQSHRALIPNLDSLVQVLGETHRTLGSEAQLLRRVLLESAGGERRGWILSPLATLDLRDLERLP